MTRKRKILLTISIVVLWEAALVLSLGGYYIRMLVTAYLGVMLMWGCAATVAGLMDMFFRKHTLVLFMGLAAVGFGGSVTLANYAVVNFQALQTQDQAMVIWQALADYHDRYRRYPESLDELVPEFMDEIPKTKMGWHDEYFGYFRETDDDSYGLHWSAAREYYPAFLNWCIDDPPPYP